MMTLNDKSVLVLGLGETGLSMLRYLKTRGARVRAADSRSAPPGLAEAKQYLAEPLIHCGAFSDALFDGVELIAISPGVPLRDPAVARAVASGIPVTGDIELFAQRLASGDLPDSSKVLAITGSNGKTTVTSMVEHLCQCGGQGRGGGGQYFAGSAGCDAGARREPARNLGAGTVQLPAGNHFQPACRCGDRAEYQRGPSRSLCRHRRIQRREGAHLRGLRRAGAEPGRCALHEPRPQGMQNRHLRSGRAGFGGRFRDSAQRRGIPG